MTAWPAPSTDSPVTGHIVVPGSKSATARAFVLGALSSGPSVVRGALRARDTGLMRDALGLLGVQWEETGPDEVRLTPPTAPLGGATIDVGLSGTVARFVAAVAALDSTPTRFVGDAAMSARPMAPLLGALASLGASVEGDAVPFTIGGPLFGERVELDSSSSSQFVTALLLVASRLPDGLTIVHRGGTLPSRPLIEMTVRMLRARGVAVDARGDAWSVLPGPMAALDVEVEPDLMNTAVFLAAALATGGAVTTAWPSDSVQAQGRTLEVLEAFGARARAGDGSITVEGPPSLAGVDLDLADVSELTPIVAALAALATTPSRIRGVEHIRGHETDRLSALATGLGALGGSVTEAADGLVIEPAPLHGGLWACHADHRLAHAGALLGLVVHGIELDDVASTSKTMPDFPRRWTTLVGHGA